METDFAPFVHTAVLRLDTADVADVGAAVTSSLCGSWAHDGLCRWPHNNGEDGSPGQQQLDLPELAGTTGFRTVFVAAPIDEDRVRELIDATLRDSSAWTTVATGSRELTEDERELAGRLLASAPD